MEIAKIKKYKLPKESLLYVQEPQLMLFEDEFKKFGKKDFIDIEFSHRGYTVNNNIDAIIDRKYKQLDFSLELED